MLELTLKSNWTFFNGICLRYLFKYCYIKTEQLITHAVKDDFAPNGLH